MKGGKEGSGGERSDEGKRKGDRMDVKRDERSEV